MPRHSVALKQVSAAFFEVCFLGGISHTTETVALSLVMEDAPVGYSTHRWHSVKLDVEGKGCHKNKLRVAVSECQT